MTTSVHPSWLLVAIASCTAMVLAGAGCGDTLSLKHSETPCVYPGQVVTLHTSVAPGTTLSYRVQDDFGGELMPRIPPITADPSGQATVTWQSPNRLSTTTLHFLLTARDGSRRADLDIHVVVGGNGRSC